MQSYFFENSSRLTSGTELTEVEQILRYFRRDIYTKKMKLNLQAGSESRLSYARCAIAASAWTRRSGASVVALQAPVALTRTRKHLGESTQKWRRCQPYFTK